MESNEVHSVFVEAEVKSPSEMLVGPTNVQQDRSSPVTIITPSSLSSSIVSVAPLVKAPLTISTEMLLQQIPAMVSPASLSSPEKEMAGGLITPSQSLVIQEEDTNDENTTPQAISTDREEMLPGDLPVPSSALLGLALAKATPRRQRGEKKPIPEEMKDEKYYERRKRNNMAAKKSRDQRKLREDKICRRTEMLENDNAVLRVQVSNLREEAFTLRNLLIKKRMEKLNNS